MFRVKREGERQKGQRRNEKGELFKLPKEELASFSETAMNVERLVLAAEEARLGLQIIRMQADLKRAKSRLR
jgi:hypothetical protein